VVGLFSSARAPQVPRRLRRNRARSFFPALIGILLKYFYRRSIKVIYDNRGLYIDEHIYGGRIGKSSIKEKIFRRLENIILKKCDSIVVVSNKFKIHLLDYKIFPVKKIKNKIEVIPNRTRIYPNQDDVFRNKLIQEEKVVCAYSGSLAVWQGTNLFYDIFNSLTIAFQAIYFKILTYEQHLLPGFSKYFLRFGDRIQILNVSQDKVFNELVRSNFGLLFRPKHILSKVCSPIKFAEYLAAGLPVIVNEGIGDTEEIIIKYNVGVIIRNNEFDKAAQEMKELLQDKEIYNRCLSVAKKEFDIEVSFKHYENIYHNLLG